MMPETAPTIDDSAVVNARIVERLFFWMFHKKSSKYHLLTVQEWEEIVCASSQIGEATWYALYEDDAHK